MKTFLLDIVTPERLVYSEQVEQVSAPSTDGQITILPHHVPIFSSLTDGEIAIRRNGEDTFLAIGGGFVEVTPTKTVILVTRAAHADELDEAAILKAKKEAEEVLARGASGESLTAARALLRSTLVDLKVVRRRRRPHV